jgi:hypothetical protein
MNLYHTKTQLPNVVDALCVILAEDSITAEELHKQVTEWEATSSTQVLTDVEQTIQGDVSYNRVVCHKVKLYGTH